MTSSENLQEIQLHEIRPGTVIRIHTDYDQVIETPVKRSVIGWGATTVYPSNEPDTPGMAIRDSCKVYLVREDIEEPEHPGSVITAKYRSSDGECVQVKVHDDSWYMSGSSLRVCRSWSEILECCYDIKVVHEGYDPDRESVKIPESWDDLKDVPKFISYLVDREGDRLRRDEMNPDQWCWCDGGVFAWEADELSQYSPFIIDPEHPLTNRGQE